MYAEAQKARSSFRCELRKRNVFALDSPSLQASQLLSEIPEHDNFIKASRLRHQRIIIFVVSSTAVSLSNICTIPPLECICWDTPITLPHFDD